MVPIEQEVDANATTTLPILSANKVKHGTALEVLCNEHYEFPVRWPPLYFMKYFSIL